MKDQYIIVEAFDRDSLVKWVNLKIYEEAFGVSERFLQAMIFNGEDIG